MKQKNLFTTNMFWKVDTEGAEATIIPSWYRGLSELLSPKPTLFISMHDKASVASPHLKQLFAKTMQLYRYAGSVGKFHDDQPLTASVPEGKLFSENDICDWCDILASDFPVNFGDVPR